MNMVKVHCIHVWKGHDGTEDDNGLYAYKS